METDETIVTGNLYVLRLMVGARALSPLVVAAPSMSRAQTLALAWATGQGAYAGEEVRIVASSEVRPDQL